LIVVERTRVQRRQKNRILREIYDAETFSVEGSRPYLRFAGWLAPTSPTPRCCSRSGSTRGLDHLRGRTGTMLDLDHGPTPSSPRRAPPGGACTGSGIPPQDPCCMGISKGLLHALGGGRSPPSCTARPRISSARAATSTAGHRPPPPLRLADRWAPLRRAHQRMTPWRHETRCLDACETVKICTGYRYQGDVLTSSRGRAHLQRGRARVRGAVGMADSTQEASGITSCPPRPRDLERLSELIGWRSAWSPRPSATRPS